jgi:hypothetical protein
VSRVRHLVLSAPATRTAQAVCGVVVKANTDEWAVDAGLVSCQTCLASRLEISAASVTLIDLATGERRTMKGLGSRWNWTEGNLSCDCNRKLLMRARSVEFPCGESRFAVLALTWSDGREASAEELAAMNTGRVVPDAMKEVAS